MNQETIASRVKSDLLGDVSLRTFPATNGVVINSAGDDIRRRSRVGWRYRERHKRLGRRSSADSVGGVRQGAHRNSKRSEKG